MINFQINSKYKTQNSKKSQHGFTLIEVLIYGMIFSLLLFLVTQVFLTINASSANSLAMASLQQNYTRIFSDLNQTIRNTGSVDFPLAGGSLNSLSLDNGEVIYQVEEGVFKKTIGGVPVELSDQGVSITSINFQNVAEATQTATIKINATIQSNYLLSGGRQISENFQTTIGLR